jgi:hypothetical protein
VKETYEQFHQFLSLWKKNCLYSSFYGPVQGICSYELVYSLKEEDVTELLEANSILVYILLNAIIMFDFITVFTNKAYHYIKQLNV